MALQLHLLPLVFTAHTQLAASTVASTTPALLVAQAQAPTAASCHQTALESHRSHQACLTQLAPTSTPQPWVLHTPSPSPCPAPWSTPTSPPAQPSTSAVNSSSTTTATPSATPASKAGTCLPWTAGPTQTELALVPQEETALLLPRQPNPVLHPAGPALHSISLSSRPRWSLVSHLSGPVNGAPLHLLPTGTPVLAQ